MLQLIGLYLYSVYIHGTKLEKNALIKVYILHKSRHILILGYFCAKCIPYALHPTLILFHDCIYRMIKIDVFKRYFLIFISHCVSRRGAKKNGITTVSLLNRGKIGRGKWLFFNPLFPTSFTFPIQMIDDSV